MKLSLVQAFSNFSRSLFDGIAVGISPGLRNHRDSENKELSDILNVQIVIVTNIKNDFHILGQISRPSSER